MMINIVNYFPLNLELLHFLSYKALQKPEYMVWQNDISVVQHFTEGTYTDPCQENTHGG